MILASDDAINYQCDAVLFQKELDLVKSASYEEEVRPKPRRRVVKLTRFQ